MESLFKSKFPFVTKDDSELNQDELKIKRQYEANYKTKTKDIQTENDSLSEVRGLEQNTTRKSRRSGNDSVYNT